jgi:hypothetical protein
VDVLTWTLARMILRVDSPWGAGDVMCRIGKYVCSLQHRKEAQKEAHSERTDIDSQRDRELAANAQDLRKLRVAIPLSVSRNPG